MKSLASLLILLVVSLSMAQSTHPNQKPLSEHQVFELVSVGVDSARIANAVQERGIDFDLTEEYLTSLRSLGAKEVLVNALREAGTRPLSKDDLLRLLARGEASQKIEMAVKQRGIALKPTDVDLDTLRIAGATEALLEALSKAKQAKPSVSAPPVSPAPSSAPASSKGGSLPRSAAGGTVGSSPPQEAHAVCFGKQGVALYASADRREVLAVLPCWAAVAVLRRELPVDFVRTREGKYGYISDWNVALGPAPTPQCPAPFAFAETDRKDPQKVKWEVFDRDVMYWWTQQGGANKYPKLCAVSHQAANYAIVWRAPSGAGVAAVIHIEVYRVAGGEIQPPALYVSKRTASGKGAFEDAAKYLVQQAPASQ